MQLCNPVAQCTCGLFNTIQNQQARHIVKMGKTRKHKIKYVSQSNPLSRNELLFANNDGILLEDDSSQVDPVQAFREQLLNPNVEEKLNGLQSFAVLTSNKEKVHSICQTDVVRIAAPFLCDKNEPVRNATAGALRNLSVCGMEVCDYLVEQDILTPLLTLLGEYEQDAQWTPQFDRSMRDQLDLRSDIFLQAINLLWNLCESSSLALDTFNQTQMLVSLIRYLDVDIFGLEISISVAQCLLVVSESNPKSWHVLNENVTKFLQLINAKGSNGITYLRTIAAGILANVPALAADYIFNILNALTQTLEVDNSKLLEEILLKLSQKDENTDQVHELEIKMDTADDETEDAAVLRRRRQELPTEADIIVRNMGYLLDAQRVAAEVLTNVCSSDEDEEWVDDETSDISESECVVDYESNTNGLTNGQVFETNDKLPVQVVEVIKSSQLIEKLWRCAQPLEDTLAQHLRKASESLLTKSKNLRISALICLQNLCNSLCQEDLGGASGIYNVWVELGQQVFKSSNDLSILEPSTSLMRSALEKLKCNKELFSQMTESDLELMLNGVQNCSMAEIRANWLRMLGTLGCLLPEPLVKIIVKFIVQTCAQEEDVWTISEALDALMDMFADNDWIQIVVELELPVLVKELEKRFRSKIRQQKRELNERYPAVQTVRTNLTRFVQYIEKESLKST